MSSRPARSCRLALYGSCAFEIPPPILRHVTRGGLDLSQACHASGITDGNALAEGTPSSLRLERGAPSSLRLERAARRFAS